MEDKDKQKAMQAIEEFLRNMSDSDPRKAIKLGAALMLEAFGYIPTEVLLVVGMSEMGLGGKDKRQYLCMAGLIGCAVKKGHVSLSEINEAIAGHREALDRIALEEKAEQEVKTKVPETVH